MNGQKIAEGSDGAGSELDKEEGSGKDECINSRRKCKNLSQQNIRSHTEKNDNEQITGVKEDRKEHKVIIKLVQEGEWNPIQLTKAIHKLIGEVRSARVLCNASLLQG